MEHENTEKEWNLTKENYIRFKNIAQREMLHRRAIMERFEYRNRRLRFVMLAFAASLIGLIYSLMSIYLMEGSFIDKKILQEDISNIVKNDGDLRAIKQALITQPKVSDLKILFSPQENHYRGGVALSIVLDDVRLSAYRTGDKSILPKLEPIILEYEETNPFDKLQTGQKDYFENIRIKTGIEYPKISNDINNLADELFQKNQLVNEYLSDSKMSFWISVTALFLSLLIGGYQIFSSRPEAMRRMLLGILDDNNGQKQERSNNSDQKCASEAGASA